MNAKLRRACWCGAETASRAYRIRLKDGLRLGYYRCDGCGVVVQHPSIPNETLSKYYDPSYYGSTRKKFIPPISTLVESFQRQRAEMVTKHIPAGGRVLDVGCGNGQLLVNLKRAGLAVEGTEWTADSAARVPQEEEITVHVGDLLTLELPPQAYNGIVIWHVLEHVRDPDATIRKASELLKPGGYLFLAYPNQGSWQARLFGRNWFHLDPPRHLYGFTEASSKALLAKHHFSIKQKSTWSLEQNPYGALQSFLNSLGFFDREQAYESLKGTRRINPLGKLLDLLCVATLAPFAILWSIIESMCGNGGTLILAARRQKSSPPKIDRN